MPEFNIEVINFEPAPDSTLLDYFQKRLTELYNNDKVTDITSARLILMWKKPPINTFIDYMMSADIPMPGRAYPSYHVCEVVVWINNVECIISYYTEVYFEGAIDYVINEALSRCYRYF